MNNTSNATMLCLGFLAIIGIGSVIHVYFIHKHNTTPHEIEYESDEFMELGLECVTGWSASASVWKGKYGYYKFDADGCNVVGPYPTLTSAKEEGTKYFK